MSPVICSVGLGGIPGERLRSVMLFAELSDMKSFLTGSSRCIVGIGDKVVSSCLAVVVHFVGHIYDVNF